MPCFSQLACDCHIGQSSLYQFTFIICLRFFERASTRRGLTFYFGCGHVVSEGECHPPDSHQEDCSKDAHLTGAPKVRCSWKLRQHPAWIQTEVRIWPTPRLAGC